MIEIQIDPLKGVTGYHRVGDIVTKSLEQPNFHFLFKSDNLKAFMPPQSYTAVKFSKSNYFLFEEKVTFWRPDCPNNYVALGDVLMLNDAKNNTVEPDESDVSCVHLDYVTQKDHKQVLKTFDAERVNFNLEDHELEKDSKRSNWMNQNSVQYIGLV